MKSKSPARSVEGKRPTAEESTKGERRLGNVGAANRALLVTVAEQLLRDEGYAALTARKITDKAGVKLPLLYYYFKTMDDLILEVARKNVSTRLKRFVRALASPEPLRELWELNRDASGGFTTTELMALANHRETIRTELVALGRQFRELQIEALERFLAEKGIDSERFPAAGIVTIVTALTRTMKQDCALGLTDGYDEAVRLIEYGIDFLSNKEK